MDDGLNLSLPLVIQHRVEIEGLEFPSMLPQRLDLWWPCLRQTTNDIVDGLRLDFLRAVRIRITGREEVDFEITKQVRIRPDVVGADECFDVILV